MKQGSVQEAGTEDPYAYCHPKCVKCTTAATEQCMMQCVCVGGGAVYGFFIPLVTDPYTLQGNKEEY